MKQSRHSASGFPAPSLALFTQHLRDYQEDVVADAVEFVSECWDGKHEKQRRLYASPAGSGKGTAELALLREFAVPDAEISVWILTPSLEIIRGFLERCGCDSAKLAECGPEKLATLAEQIHVTTPTRFRNRVCDGERVAPDIVIYDEVHHAVEGNEVSGTLFAVAPQAVWVGFTATPYRGSPAATAALREAWGEPILVMDIPEAVRDGFQQLPSFRIHPLVDDDVVKVANGRFVAKRSTNAALGRVADLCTLVKSLTHIGLFDMPTALTVPSSEVAAAVVEGVDRLGVEARMITQATKARDRAHAYARCRERKALLVSIRVVSEGVDLPWLKRLIDARPTMSPVSWVQQIGRIMRPGGRRPEYIATNRNLERHAYLLGGLVPRETIAELQEAFEGPSKRLGARTVGLEALRRHKPIPLPLSGGASGTLWNVYSTDEDGVIEEWAMLLDPVRDDPIVARRYIEPRGEDEEKRPASAYGKWKRATLPSEFTGFATSRFTQRMSEKQRKWWKRAARRVGLDDLAADTVTGRQFTALPVLSDLKARI